MSRFTRIKPDAIFISDMHLMEKTPVCRLDEDFITTQLDKLNWLSNLQVKYNCPIYHAGDLFDKWKNSLWFIALVMQYFPKKFYTIIGNHDMPQHNIHLIEKSSIYLMEQAGFLTILDGTHFDQIPEKESITIKGRRILIWHNLIYTGKDLFPGHTANLANDILKKYTQYDLIVTGDNHKTFIAKHNDRILINPGSMLRTTAEQMEHEPCVFLYYAETNRVEEVFFPIQKGVITREHIEVKKNVESRLLAFVEKLQNKGNKALSFEDNVMSLLDNENVDKKVKKLVKGFVF